MARTGHDGAVDHTFDLTAAPATVLADLTSEDFLRAFAAEVGVEIDSLSCDSGLDPATAQMDWRFSTQKPGIPTLARKMLPQEVRLNWAQQWGPVTDGRAKGDLEVQLLGKPQATSTGHALLLPGPDGSRLTTTTSTKAALPFPIAGRVQSMIDKDLVGWILSVQARVINRRHSG